MEVHLKPKSLAADPISSNAEQEYIHWKTTMKILILHWKLPKKVINTSFWLTFPALLYSHNDTQTYNEAIEIVDSIYNKPKNIWYSRHVLLHTKQKQHQSLDDYLCVLKNLSKDCSYKTVSAEEYANQSILSAFIGGISSSFIQQRLLECDND